MALQATHVLIARDLLPTLNVRQPHAYYTATIYPDSRYVTGIPREATHGHSCPQDARAVDATDFEKGWAVHLRYDDVAGELQKAFIPPGRQLTRDLDDAWATFTAAKVVEDMDCAKRLGDDLRLFASLRGPKRPPRGEAKNLLDRHYRLLLRLYGNGPPMMADYEAHYARLFPRDVVRNIIRHAERIREDAALLRAALSVYDWTFRYLETAL